MFHNALKQLTLAGINFPLRIATLLLALSLAAGMGLLHLRVDTGFSSLISATNPDKPAYERITREFGSDNRTIIYIRDAQLWTPEKLEQLEKMHRALEGLEFVSRVDDLFTLQNVHDKDGSLESRIFMPEAPKEQAAADRILTEALNNPLIVRNFISADGQVMAMLVSVVDRGKQKDFDLYVNTIFKNIIDANRAGFDDIFQLGAPRINAELKHILFRDLQLLGPLSVIVLVLSIIFFLRSGTAAVLPLLTSLLSLIWTFGLMGWLDIPINILTAMLPSLVIVIGSTEDTHLMAAYFQAINEADGDRKAAARLTMRMMGLPMMLTIFTTAFGFASNIFSHMGLIQDFAMASTMAILANGIITILLVPMILSFMGPKKSRRNSDQEQAGLSGRFTRIFTAINERHPNLLLCSTLVVCVFFVYHAAKLNVSNDPMSYFRGSAPLVQDANKLHRDLAGMKVFFITLESDQERAFMEPKNLRKLADIQRFLEQQEMYDSTISLADYIKLINREFHQGKSNYFDIPKQSALVSQYLLFFHRNELESYVSHDYRRANIIVRHNISDSATLNKYVRELKGAAEKISGRLIKVDVTGENLMINAATEHLMIAQIKSLGILLIVIFLLMSAMFTSFKGGLVSLVPSLFPIIMMFGVMGLLDIPLNPGTAMVAVIAIGIAIDGSIHLFSHYNDLSRKTRDNVSAIRATVRHEASPMIATTMALALGFGILLFSDFTLIAQFGALSAATMFFALYANLLVTPVIMSHIRLIGLYQIVSMTVQKEVLENSPLFRDMSSYQIRKAILMSETRQFDCGDLLMQQDTIGRSMYLILSGEVEVQRHTNNRMRKIAVMRAGQVFGEIGYIREEKRTADIRALSKVEVLCFDFERLQKDLKFFPYIVAKLNFNISYILGERIEEIRARLDTQIAKTAKADRSETL